MGLAVLFGFMVVPQARAADRMQWNFDEGPVDGLPSGMRSLSGKWAIHAEADAPTPPNALCQTARGQHPALLLSDNAYGNLSLTTRFKPISGSETQVAAVLFRLQDQENYYMLRVNALGGSVSVSRYQAGERTLLKKVAQEVPTGLWQELRVEVKGNRIRAFINGEVAVETTDDAFKSGKVALGTEGDSITCFDNVRVE